MNKKIISTKRTEVQLEYEILLMMSKHLDIDEIPVWLYQYNWTEEEIPLSMITNNPVIQDAFSKYLVRNQSQEKDGLPYGMLEYFKQVDKYLEMPKSEAPPIVIIDNSSNNRYEIKDGGRRILVACARGDVYIRAYVGRGKKTKD